MAAVSGHCKASIGTSHQQRQVLGKWALWIMLELALHSLEAARLQGLLGMKSPDTPKVFSENPHKVPNPAEEVPWTRGAATAKNNTVGFRSGCTSVTAGRSDLPLGRNSLRPQVA